MSTQRPKHHKQLSPEQLAGIELAKELEAALLLLLTDTASDPRWNEIARTDVEKATMSVIRSITA